MRVINPQQMNAKALAEHERLFVEFWYSMTHMLSLDSYRVRCMNARTIIRELNEELHLGLVNDKELSDICAEAAEILEGDPVVRTTFPAQCSLTMALLSEVTQDTKKSARDRDPLRYAVEDLCSTFEKHYLAKLCELLPSEIRPGNDDGARAVVGSLLTDLVDRGWTMETLFWWHRHFLAVPQGRDYSFTENVEFMLRQLQRDPQPFQVILRLSGSDRLSQAGEVADFAVSDDPPFTPTSPKQQKLARPNRFVSFAEIQVEATDHLSAAINAREAIEQWIDLVRYDFETRRVTVDELAYVRRVGDGRVKLPQVRHSVPNPPGAHDKEGFQAFCGDLNAVLSRSDVRAESRRLLQAAIRQYRFGRDSQSYKDKFLNWWMGLESLCKLGKGAIGEAVRKNASPLLTLSYMHLLLRDLLATLKHCGVSWPEDLATASGCGDLDDLTLSALVTVLCSERKQALLWDQCIEHPVVGLLGRELGQWFLGPKTAAARVGQHRRHVEWQLGRLYRIRCCLIHGSDVRFRLGLYAANLEFYLKQAILAVLAAFRNHPHLVNLEDVFGRAEVALERVLCDLEEDGAGEKEIRQVVFAGLVITDT